MTQKFTTLITGGFARVPGKVIAQHLPQGSKLILEPEDNPYDQWAIKVSVSAEEVPESERAELAQKLEGYGCDWAEMLADTQASDYPGIHIGYVAASDGKPLAKAGLTEGNRELLQRMKLEGDRQPTSVTLRVDGGGTPWVDCEWDAPLAQEA